MPRKYIEFIQTAELPWRSPVGDWRPEGDRGAYVLAIYGAGLAALALGVTRR